MSPGVERLPETIAIYPLLSSSMPRPVPERRLEPAAPSKPENEKRMNIVPPAESKLVVTMQSEMLTSQLSAELARRGFSIKEIPVEVPENGEERDNTFFMSLASLQHLREAYGLEAVIVGNAYFVPDKVDMMRFNVASVFLRVVDTETLDVLCHLTLNDQYYGESVDVVARVLADKLAEKAQLTPIGANE